MPIVIHNPDDPRVKKTRKGLRDALIRLILQKGYDAISIQEIADEAQAARITFYRHYRDKEELLTDCMNTLYNELKAKTQQLSRQALLDGYTPVQTLYDHIEEHEALYHILFSSRGTQAIHELMRHHLANHVIYTMTSLGRLPIAEVPLEIIAYHAASAQLGLAIWWLEHNKPYSSRYMARISMWLTLTGLLNVVGVSDFKPPMPDVEAWSS